MPDFDDDILDPEIDPDELDPDLEELEKIEEEDDDALGDFGEPPNPGQDHDEPFGRLRH
ncbi:MAG TPA: hypothetical protein PLK06_01365 [bacterium]|jgi:hypothetical protein|nr:hypothetical protein [Patescibacteria group bacterium]HRH31950.1 hypothetical protein [bacterium]